MRKIYPVGPYVFDSRAATDRTLAAAVFKTTPLYHGAAREAMVGASAGLFIFRSLKAYNKTTFKKGEGIWNNVKTSFGARRHK